MGVRVDYLSPTLYLIDVVWAGWMATKIFNLKFEIFKQKEKFINFQNVLVGLLVVLNVLVAGNKWVAIYRWLRIGQLVISYKVIKLESYKVKKYLNLIIPCWIVIEVLLGMAQITKGGSLQGIWYWLGERRFSYTGIGVAQISWLGSGLVRAYGTFSHPNSMAGFILISLLIWVKTHPLPPPLTRRGKIISNIFYWIVVWMGVVGMVIAGSRVVWILAALLPIINNYPPRGLPNGRKLIITNYKKALGYGLLIVGVVMVVLGMVGTNYRLSDFVGGWDTDSAVKRISLSWSAIRMWKDNFVLGVGLGNFTSELPAYQQDSPFYWFQPVHNIFLLWATETGIVGVMLLIKFLVQSAQCLVNKKKWLILGAIVVTGMLDHYWLTLPQNSWLVTMVLAML
jgi:hypothetical protein